MTLVVCSLRLLKAERTGTWPSPEGSSDKESSGGSSRLVIEGLPSLRKNPMFPGRWGYPPTIGPKGLGRSIEILGIRRRLRRNTGGGRSAAWSASLYLWSRPTPGPSSPEEHLGP